MRLPFYLSLPLALFTLLTQAADPAPTGKKNHQKNTDPATITLYAAGDIADCHKKTAVDSMAARTSDLILSHLNNDPDALVLTLGDNTYPVGRPEEFSRCYEPTWGRFKNRTLPAPGNHEYGMPKALGYFNYFGDLAGPERRGYYAVQAGHWKIISLNSNLDPQAMQKQLEWLQQELTQKKSRCTLAFWHHPVFSSGGHGRNERMQPAWKILANAQADLVLAAHDHDYERFVPLDGNGERDDKNGMRSFVVGTGGAQLTPMFLPRLSTEIRDNSTHGVLKLRLHEQSYEWEFLPVPGQRFTDKGSGNCH
ncbi:metallophosphoesterase family protein [Undibacterium oligocarboniphilum]|jgi:hypothetical protein|uniref:Metallophosphoesterase n=1 Tax=Undibacterium oligocarboniphilum TaxID=666702 RepID=A0A850QAM9_9BURK|nr:metallophosphoesterase [Undibacterium oligocarboniphilum]MBC3869779.1 metallophosphoesterase [Undibacterium oligocarboniphilum]NVO77382.1 metallophosphoesterase [Undibacterium oligocarboniphilum]